MAGSIQPPEIVTLMWLFIRLDTMYSKIFDFCVTFYTFACIRTSQTCNIPEMSLRDKDCEFCF